MHSSEVKTPGKHRVLKVGVVWHCAYPWDVRMEKIIKVCSRNGHRVSMLCRGNASLAAEEVLDGVTIQRVGTSLSVRFPAVAKAMTFPLFLNPIWVLGVARFIKAGNFDVLVVRDLPLAFLVGALCKIFDVPVILDMAENYPAALMAYRNPLYKPFLFSNAWLPKQYEKFTLKFLRRILVVTEEQARRLEELGMSPLQITVIGNTPELSRLSDLADQPIDRAPLGNGDSLNLLFVGKLDAHRGVELLIRAMPELVRDFPGVTLTLVGDGTERARLERIVEALGISSRVRMPGWVEFSRVWKYIASSTICLIPHIRSEHTETTLPNKLFDYMALGKPVVASNCAPIARVIHETSCGLTFRSGDLADLSTALRTLLSNAEMRHAQGSNGRIAVQGRYNWESEISSLLEAIESAAPHLSTRSC